MWLHVATRLKMKNISSNNHCSMKRLIRKLAAKRWNGRYGVKLWREKISLGMRWKLEDCGYSVLQANWMPPQWLLLNLFCARFVAVSGQFRVEIGVKLWTIVPFDRIMLPVEASCLKAKSLLKTILQSASSLRRGFRTRENTKTTDWLERLPWIFVPMIMVLPRASRCHSSFSLALIPLSPFSVIGNAN